MKQRIKVPFAGGVLALALFGVAAAGALEDARTAEQRGDYATEIALLRPLADQGNAVAQTGLGWMYEHGHGVPQDYAQALVWYRKASLQGDARAQLKLGVMYDNGRGVAQDYGQTAVWYRKAADQGNVPAQDLLGVMYFEGRGVAQDYGQTAVWPSMDSLQRLIARSAAASYLPRTGTSTRECVLS